MKGYTLEEALKSVKEGAEKTEEKVRILRSDDSFIGVNEAGYKIFIPSIVGNLAQNMIR